MRLEAGNGVVLRGWDPSDAEAILEVYDAELAKWFDLPADGTAPTKRELKWQVQKWRFGGRDRGNLALAIVRESEDAEGQRQEQLVGGVEMTGAPDGRAELTWWIYGPFRGMGLATVALRRLIQHCFEDLELERVEAYIDPENDSSRRLAAKLGLRREGVARARESRRQGVRPDYVQVARLRTDPEPDSPEGFLGVLNSGLPTKRVIAQGLITDGEGRALLCELTYKKEWDLPGGVVDRHESPAAAVRREVAEELQLDVEVGELLEVNWLPAYKQWDDALLLVFNLGVHPEARVDAVLQRSEIAGIHWCDIERVREHCAPYAARHLERLLQRQAGDNTLYLEDGADPKP